MMTIDELKKRKNELHYTTEYIAKLSGVPVSTVRKIFSGATETPRYETLMALERVLSVGESSYMNIPAVSENACQYGKGAYKKQGDYTIEDYYAWPEEERIELIDGVIYAMSSPTSVHQDLVRDMGFALHSYIKGKGGECTVYMGPLDVQLGDDDKTIVQPDVFVICDKNKITPMRIVGSPDMIIEILSPSTRKKDMSIKLAKYIQAEVREYWLVDPDKEMVIVYDIEHELTISMYSFKDLIPVAIFNGDCIIDFSQM